jgi:hypothetical protein
MPAWPGWKTSPSKSGLCFTNGPLVFVCLFVCKFVTKNRQHIYSLKNQELFMLIYL